MQKVIIISVAALAAIGVMTIEASARPSCLKGAVVGGIVGHVLGHHGVAGAAAGCVYERRKGVRDRDINRNFRAGRTYNAAHRS